MNLVVSVRLRHPTVTAWNWQVLAFGGAHVDTHVCFSLPAQLCILYTAKKPLGKASVCLLESSLPAAA